MVNLFFEHDTYNVLIRQDVFDIIKGYDEAIRYEAEKMAIAQAKGYLLNTFNDAYACLIFEVTAYDAQRVYQPYQAVLYNNILYTCLLPNTTTTPPAVYNETANYTTGDIVAYNTGNYECINNTSGIFNSSDWQQITTVWLQKERRQAVLLMHLMDLVLYHIHSRINPRNVPPLRLERYEQALSWFKQIQRGAVSLEPDCPANYLYPATDTSTTGNNSDLIEYGSYPKRHNYY